MAITLGALFLEALIGFVALAYLLHVIADRLLGISKDLRVVSDYVYKLNADMRLKDVDKS